MRIYLDGCDGSGKSTLAKYLSKRFGLDIFCLTKDSEKSMKRYLEIGLGLDNVVYDRTFFSEAIYPMIFDRDLWLDSDDIEELLDLYNCGNRIIVICTTHDYIIRDRLRQRGDEFGEVIDNLSLINKKYREIADRYNLMLVDTYEQTLEEIGDQIERRIKWSI